MLHEWTLDIVDDVVAGNLVERIRLSKTNLEHEADKVENEHR